MNINRERLLSYIPMANFMAEMNGPRAEALIHDISDHQHSIIYITPQSITGRRVGGSLTDYATKLLSAKVHETADYVVNYLGHSSYDRLLLRSSTYFIKEEDRLIGLLCVNVDITEQVRAAEAMQKFLLVDLADPAGSQPSETFGISTDELINRIVAKRTAHLNGKKPAVRDKRAIVQELLAHDVFMVKGAIPTTASLLDVSEQTIYRYIQDIKKQKGE